MMMSFLADFFFDGGKRIKQTPRLGQSLLPLKILRFYFGEKFRLMKIIPESKRGGNGGNENISQKNKTNLFFHVFFELFF